MAYTPKLNPNYLVDLQNQFNKGINTIYLALSSLGKDKKIAEIKPTPIPKSDFSFQISSIPSNSPQITQSQNQNSIFTKIDPATIPVNLFKSVSKGVSAYESEDNDVLLKIDNGTKYRFIEIKLPDGRILKGIDFDIE